MNTTTTSPNRGINQIINDGDVGTAIKKNQNSIIIGLVALVVLVLSFGLYSSFADKSKAEFNSKIYTFDTTILKTFNEKSDPKAIVTSLTKLKSEVGNYSGLVPVVIKASDILMGQSHLNEALDVLVLGQNVSKNEYADYFILSRLAVVYEDLGQDQKAIETLEKMNAHALKIFEGKNYLDMGRLYLKMGNKEKAKTSFNFVVEKAKDESEFVKIAKLYLTKL